MNENSDVRSCSTCSSRVGVTYRDRDPNLVSQALELQLPQPRSISVAATAVRRDEQLARILVALPAHRVPPTPDAFHRKLRGVGTDPNTDPSAVVVYVVYTIRAHPPQLALEVMYIDFLRLTLRPILPATVLVLSDQFLLLRID